MNIYVCTGIGMALVVPAFVAEMVLVSKLRRKFWPTMKPIETVSFSQWIVFWSLFAAWIVCIISASRYIGCLVVGRIF